MLKLYNTLTRDKKVFRPINKEKVGLYACGPTVYWYAHIGNMRSFIFSDLLHRTLRYNGYEVDFVMNITDVGHLTDDGDEGKDKMIVAMQREGKTAFEIAEFYTNSFFEDIERLNILSANTYPKATDHIDDQIKMIQKIEKNGYTYQTADGVYFDTFKLEAYGVLSGQKAEEKKAGARVDMKEKRNNTDFALWKLSDSESKRQMEWNSPWGKGFPGWHIECSAMSIKYLGQSFDIHTGGIDHVSVHHENELAQSMGANSVYHAQIWMHNEFLTVDNGKMSKSLGNLFTVKDLIDKKYDPIAFRYMVLGAHYRTKLNFTWEALEASENALFRLQDLVRDWDKPGVDSCKELEDEFMDAINNDLDTPKTLAIVWKLIDSDFSSSEKAGTLLKFNSILGLSLENYIAKPLSVSEEVNVLIKQRTLVRKEKDWKKSDLIRNQIENLGYLVEDMEDGQKLIEIRK